MIKPLAVLIGPPGAGKTTVGTRVAQLAGVDFADTDAIVEQRLGKSIPDIFIEDGEPTFREHERQVVRETIETHTGVVALGGGAVVNDETRQLLRSHRVVFLTVGLAAASPRVGFDRSRPLLLGSPRKQWLHLFNQRLPLYTEVADITVETDELTIEEAAQVVHEQLQRMDD